MHAPAHVCESLARYHPGLRLAWDGEGDRFGLIMIMRSRLASKTYHEYWRGRGPVFSRAGRPRPDWDCLGQVPMYLIDLEPEDVFSGRVLRLAKQWTRPLAARYLESAQQAGRDLESNIEAMGHDAGLRVYQEGQRGGYGAPIVAKKFIDETSNQRNTRDGTFDQTDRFVPDEIPDAWTKQAELDEGDPDDLGSVAT